MLRSLRVHFTAFALFLALAAPVRAGHEYTLFRPLVADPRENQFRMKFISYTEDWRFGTDITDSTSQGGSDDDRENVSWDIGIGTTLRSDPGHWREYKAHAGSWHAMIGVARFAPSHRSVGDGGHPIGAQTLLTFDFYHGYSPNGQFIDQRLRYHPMWVPSITIHF